MVDMSCPAGKPTMGLRTGPGVRLGRACDVGRVDTGPTGGDQRSGREPPGLGRPTCDEVMTMAMLVTHGLRTRVKDAIRVSNKHVLNPVMLRLAGRPHWYAARLEHVGRRSGRSYATPVVASAVPGGFVVPLPYGTRVDWLRNLESAGGGALVVHGRRYTLADPQVLRTSEIYADLPHGDQVRSRVWRIGYWLRVTAVPAD